MKVVKISERKSGGSSRGGKARIWGFSRKMSGVYFSGRNYCSAASVSSRFTKVFLAISAPINSKRNWASLLEITTNLIINIITIVTHVTLQSAICATSTDF